MPDGAVTSLRGSGDLRVSFIPLLLASGALLVAFGAYQLAFGNSDGLIMVAVALAVLAVVLIARRSRR